jgi:(S)-ureidoglycine aminohydrolase
MGLHMHNLGQTRTVRKRDHLLQTPDAFVRTPMPGIHRGVAIVHVSPAIGAGFTQYTAELEPSGTIDSGPAQRFVFVLSGAIELSGVQSDALEAGRYAYIPADSDCEMTARQGSRVVVIEKPYRPIAEAGAPRLFLGDEASAGSTPLSGDDSLQVQALLPNEAAFDFAVNIMTYEPGAALSQVEMHVMEHGLLMLEGGGIYRLGDCWYPVTAGDFIWMAPYCPQWFGALGKRPAKYLIYKDWNRHPLG